MKETILMLLNEVLEKNYTLEDMACDPDIVTDLGLDSLQIINFILLIEEKLEVEIDFDEFDLEEVAHFNALCDFFDSL